MSQPSPSPLTGLSPGLCEALRCAYMCLLEALWVICVRTCVLVRGAPTHSNLESHEAPKGVEIRDNSKFPKAALSPQASDRFAEGSALTKPRAVSAGFYVAYCLDRRTEELCRSYFQSVAGTRSLPESRLLQADPEGLLLPPTGMCTCVGRNTVDPSRLGPFLHTCLSRKPRDSPCSPWQPRSQWVAKDLVLPWQ